MSIHPIAGSAEREFAKDPACPSQPNMEHAESVAAVEHPSDELVISDISENTQYVNPAITAMTGYAWEEAVGQHTRILKSGRRSAYFYRKLWETITAGQVWHGEVINQRENKSLHPEETKITPVQNSNGETASHIAIKHDVTERRAAESAVRSSEEILRQLTENIREVFWMMNLALTEVLYVSPAYEQIWGQTREGLYANPERWMNSIHTDDLLGAKERFRRQVQGEILENEYRIVQPSGAIRWIRDRAFPVRDSEGNIVRLAGVAEDTTERKLSESRLVRQALYDELTDLPNRRLFRERLGQAIAGCRAGMSGAVFFIDLDQFKLVNDTLGHCAGDLLLKEVARRLLAACGTIGTLARFGSDEFALVATGFEGPESVRSLGHRLISCLNEKFRIADRGVFVGASIGISRFPQNGIDPYELKRTAYVAMHEAKRAGKRQIRFFTPKFADAALERLEMETSLRRALALSEFRLQFQPEFASIRCRLRRFEALIRWHPAGHQPIPPLKFIPIAEQNGLIVPIGTWVLREACRQCADWQSGRLRGVGVAVNISALQFASPDFISIVVRTIESTGLPPDLLELELTESVFVQDVKRAAGKLDKLRNLGVTVALDDFGTGYSSLSYLQKLPLDALKIDRSFLAETDSCHTGPAVLLCVVELAHTLGLRVIGEGVETNAQLDLLGSLGCDEIQGFLLGRPSFDVMCVENGTRNPDHPGADAGVLERVPLLSQRVPTTCLGNQAHKSTTSVLRRRSAASKAIRRYESYESDPDR